MLDWVWEMEPRKRPLRGRGDWKLGQRFLQAVETKRAGREWGDLLLYYTLGSDPALWPAGERREGEHIMHDKGYYHSYIMS